MILYKKNDVLFFFTLFIKSTLQYSFVELFLGCFKIKFLSGSGIDFLLYHCNLFVGVVIKVCLLRYVLSKTNALLHFVFESTRIG